MASLRQSGAFPRQRHQDKPQRVLRGTGTVRLWWDQSEVSWDARASTPQNSRRSRCCCEFPCRGRGALTLGPRLLMCKSADPSKALASAWMFRAALLFPVRLRLEVPCAARAQPQQTGAVSEHPPSKQVGRFILSAFLFAVLSAALAARPPSNVGRSLRQGGARQPSLDSTVAFNIGGWPWLVERIGPGP